MRCFLPAAEGFFDGAFAALDFSAGGWPFGFFAGAFGAACLGVFLAAIVRALRVAVGRRAVGGRGGTAAGLLCGSVVAGIIAVERGAVATFADGLDGHDSLVVTDAHQLHALRVAPRLTDALDGRANRLPAVGDDHHLVLGFDHGDADHRPIAVAAVDQNDALAAAGLDSELLDRRALAVAALAYREHELALGLGPGQPDDFVVRLELDGLHAGSVAAHGTHLLLVEADALPHLGGHEELRVAVGDDRSEQLIVVGDFHADDTFVPEILVFQELGLLDLPALRDCRHELPGFDLVHRCDGGDLLVALHLDEVDDGSALGVTRRLRHFVHLLHVHFAAAREEEHQAVGGSDEQLIQEIVIARLHALVAFAAALLRSILGDRRPLDVAGVRDSHDHVLFLDQVLDLNLGF